MIWRVQAIIKQKVVDVMDNAELLMELEDQIEDLRHQLYRLSRDKDLVDPAVVQMSQNLDILLNLYYRTSLTSECLTDCGRECRRVC